MMQCHVAVSQDSNLQQAAHIVSRSVHDAFGGLGCDFACVFFSPHFSEDVSSLVEIIHHKLGPKTLVGSMGAGVIGGTQEIEEHPGLVLWGLSNPNMEVTPFHLTSEKDGEAISLEGWPDKLEGHKPSQAVLLFADPFSTPIDELFALLDRHAPGALAIGGIASGGMNEGESRLIVNDTIITSGVVGVAIQGGVELRTVVSQGCQPIGERYMVTKVDRNIIQELGGIPPMERLDATLMALSESERQQAAYGLQVGIVMDEHRSEFGQGDFLIRGLLGADRQSGYLAIGDCVQEGQTIQFHIRDAQAAGADLHDLLSKECLACSSTTPKGALLFSCNGRGQRFFLTSHHDIAAVHQHLSTLPVAGFFAGGEIGPVGGKNYLHGYTASMLLFYDKPSVSQTLN
jgi:small ligand-binding sensory domain FIST